MPKRFANFAAARIALAWGIAVATIAIPVASRALAEDIEFNRDIRPILSDKCFACHGPDAAKREADLRLDLETGAKRDVDGVRPVVPGKRDQSELYRRITSDDAEQRMPPADSGKQLSAAEIELLGRWIADGAKWEKHWAFLPPKRPAIPPVRASSWTRNAIDAFVLARLEAAGMAPSAEADKPTLLRRVALDLTGLPPTPGEVDAFVADQGPDAYERAVDRLLASPRYGERMAARWLDAARYADTSGYQDDGIRFMWRWRDWVIEAYNRNLPFDRFTIEQLAGDMLPGATLEQQIASGFNRNHRTNAEGGIIAEEYAVEYVVDRLDTTSTVWLGLTMGCARCHDHKFDPITQREFYQVFAFFNNVPEQGRSIKVGNSPPMIKAPTRDQQQQLGAIESELAAAQGAYAAMQDEMASLEAQWAASFVPGEPIRWAPGESLAVHLPLDETLDERVGGKPGQAEGALAYSSGPIGHAAAFDGASAVNAGDVAKYGFFNKFTFSAWVFPQAETGTVLARMAEVADADGYSVQLEGGKLQVNLVKRWLDDALRVETEEPLVQNAWQHVAVVYDGSRKAEGVRIYVDGGRAKLKVLLDGLNQTFENDVPLRVGGGGPGARFKGLIDDVRVYAVDLDDAGVALLADKDPIDAIVATSAAERTPAQAARLRAYWLANHAPPHVQAARHKIAELGKKKFDFEENFPTTMVMVEMPTPRDSFVLARGQYDKPGEKVTPGVPAVLNPLPDDKPRDRLAFARWLVSRENPLTARVAVNRYWQSFFGTGLVKTVDDFGAQGDPPRDVALLDWLASEFVDNGWNVKALQKLIVTSATYRQSAKASAGDFERDPENLLLARGPRLRLPAEMIRDQALAAAGLLVEEQGGPSVKPYQPPGLWKELTGGKEFEQDHGRGLYRRSLYTFWKRTIAPPSMITFDASPREACTVRETRTNTPLQALTLLNETTFVEAARVLAQRVMTSTCATPEERIALAFKLVLGRAPSEQESKVLAGGLAKHQERFRAQPAEAEKLLQVGEAPREAKLDACELAAYATVANLILNLDEAVTKE